MSIFFLVCRMVALLAVLVAAVLTMDWLVTIHWALCVLPALVAYRLSERIAGE